jgi:hypothetical protein
MHAAKDAVPAGMWYVSPEEDPLEAEGHGSASASASADGAVEEATTSSEGSCHAGLGLWWVRFEQSHRQKERDRRDMLEAYHKRLAPSGSSAQPPDAVSVTALRGEQVWPALRHFRRSMICIYIYIPVYA